MAQSAASGHRRKIKPIVWLAALVIALATGGAALACDTPVSVCDHPGSGSLGLITGGAPATVIVDAGADSAVRFAAANFAQDLGRVGGRDAQVQTSLQGVHGTAVIIGVVGHSPILDGLEQTGKIAPGALAGKWEAYRQIVVDNPAPGVPRALVIAGSDRRGAVFGTYDISQKIGVSPWYWFADVPTVHHASLWLTAGSREDAPRVRYRGFFINDEEPAFGPWARAKFGGINSKMYAHVFELGLRLKANFMWPAMWSKAFAVDDPRNMVLADAMGMVMGTSHHEPMMRAQEEWHMKSIPHTGGAWDYTTNAANLRAFWRGGIERMMSKGHGESYESLVTVGMRGDGDEPMAEGTATDLLERIVADQRQIIADVTAKPASQTPQVWALYKEVQDYYDHGMKVPDDVTLLFADDNWGQVRRLPRPGAPARKGGYGVYYHFDYVGGPRSYKWIDTNQIEKVWQQMDLAWHYGARDLWIVNVGDIKPMEYPLSFFLQMAWNPDAMTPDALARYPRQWASRTFGADHADAIGDLLTRYGKYTARRKPELVDADSFALGPGTGALLDGGEFGRMVADWGALAQRTEAVKATLRPDQLASYYELVEYPILAMTNLYRLYDDVAWNARLAKAGDPRANLFADRAEAAFRHDSELTVRYHALLGGKWNHMMAQSHIGYTGWSDPPRNIMPSLTRVADGARPIPPIRFAAAPASVPPGIIAIEAGDFSTAHDARGLRWQAIPNLGRTAGAVIALPQGQPATSPADGVRLDYQVMVDQPGPAVLSLYLAPTLDVLGQGGVRIGVAIDDGPVQTLTSVLSPANSDGDTPDQRRWAEAVKNNVVRLSADMGPLERGRHVIKVWRIDDNAVLEKLVLSTVPLPPSYLGPRPATARNK